MQTNNASKSHPNSSPKIKNEDFNPLENIFQLVYPQNIHGVWMHAP